MSPKLSKILILFILSIALFVGGPIFLFLTLGQNVAITSYRSPDEATNLLYDVANTAVSKAAKNKNIYDDPVSIAEDEIDRLSRQITLPARSTIDHQNANNGLVPIKYKIKERRCWLENESIYKTSEGNRGTRVVCEIIPYNITFKVFMAAPGGKTQYVDEHKEYDVTENGTKGSPITARATIAYQYKE